LDLSGLGEGQVAGSCEQITERSGTVKFGESIDYLTKS